MAAWLERALTETNTIPTKVQKGFLMGIFLEPQILDAALQEASKNRKSLSMMLIDLKNAFGSVPHSRIVWALQRSGAPSWVSNYVINFYGHIQSKLQCKSWEITFLQVQRGVLQGIPSALCCSCWSCKSRWTALPPRVQNMAIRPAMGQSTSPSASI